MRKLIAVRTLVVIFRGLLSTSAVAGCLAVTCLLASAPLGAQGEVPELLAGMERALGIEDGLLRRLESLYTVARVDGPRGSFTMAVRSSRPLRVELRQTSERGEGRYRLTRVGAEAWNGTEEAWQEAPASLAGFVRGHEFHLEILELTRRFTGFRPGGRDGMETPDGPVPCRRILMDRRAVEGVGWGSGGDTSDEPQRASVCLLEEGEDRGRPGELRFVPAPGEPPIRIRFADWRQIDGVAFFRSFVLTQGEDVYNYRYETIEPTWTPAGVEGQALLAWTLGEWRGVRRDGGLRLPDREAPMVMRVEPLWTARGGEAHPGGQLRRLRVESRSGEPYLGAAVELYDPDLGRWVRQYANAVRHRFVRLEGEVYGPRSVWQRPDQEGPRRSVLESERRPDGSWLRTMYRSEDGGATWGILWQDELRRRP